VCRCAERPIPVPARMTKKMPGRVRAPFCLPSSKGNGNSAEPGDKCDVEQNPKKSHLEKIATEKIFAMIAGGPADCGSGCDFDLERTIERHMSEGSQLSAVREVRKNMAKRAITAKNMQAPLVESVISQLVSLNLKPCHETRDRAWMYFSLQGSQVWPRCYQKCARVDYAITKGEDEIAALEELWLGPNELRRETSVVPC
jgi:hypothetical protein